MTRAWAQALACLFALNCSGYGQTAEVIPSADAAVYSLGIQSDGKLLVGGEFSTFNGQARLCLARLNSDGMLDPDFKPGATGGVGTNAVIYSLAPQPDGKILVGGNFTNLSGIACSNLGRLNIDGTLDQSFKASADSPVYAVVVQPDGMILVGGAFTVLNNETRGYIGRLDTNGVLDATFDPEADFPVYAMAIQPDGRIVVGGNFDWLAGTACAGLGRLKPDGTLDDTFVSSADRTVICLALQRDGKILAGGLFGTLAGQPRSGIGRLASNGSLDGLFTAEASGGITPFVYSLALQTDDKILVGGGFAALDGSPRSSIGRLMSDGTLDPSFTTEADKPVFSLGLRKDGRIWTGGLFDTLGGEARSRIGLLTNTEPATQSLAVQGSTVSWLRGGTSPEVCRAVFEISTNGRDWSSLGEATRMSGGWQLTNATIPAGASLRARGLVSGGYENASAWYLETVRPALLLDGLDASPMRLTIVGGTGQVVVMEASTDLVNWMPVATNVLSTGVGRFTDPEPELGQVRFFRAVGE